MHSKELSGNCSKVSQPALIGQSQGGFVQRYRARRGLHHLFVSLPEQHRSYVPLCAQPAGNWGVRWNKKGD